MALKRNNLIFILVFIFFGILFFNLVLLGLNFQKVNSGNAIESIEGNVTLILTNPSGEYCGDSFCNALENCSTCFVDCGACPSICGDDVCGLGEDCSSCSADCGECPDDGGDGGGSGGEDGQGEDEQTEENENLTSSFTVEPTSLKISAKIAENYKTSLTLKNNGNVPIELELKTDLKKFLSFEKSKITLAPNKEQTVEIVFFSLPDYESGVYVGLINIINLESEEKIDVPVIFELETKEIIFDVELVIPEYSKKVFPGRIVFMESHVTNVGDQADVYVDLTYEIVNIQGELVLFDQERVLIREIEEVFDKNFRLPLNLVGGEYVAIVEVRYEGSVAVASQSFEVLAYDIFIFVLSAILLMAILVDLFLLRLLIIKRREEAEKSNKKDKN